jgi:hypothetical protein
MAHRNPSQLRPGLIETTGLNMFRQLRVVIARSIVEN